MPNREYSKCFSFFDKNEASQQMIANYANFGCDANSLEAKTSKETRMYKTLIKINKEIKVRQYNPKNKERER